MQTLEEKLNEFLKELFWYEGVKEEDWKTFLECINRAEMIKQLKVGIKNGFSTEKQFQIIRKVLKENNDKTTKMQ